MFDKNIYQDSSSQDPYNLTRFIDAQGVVYSQVLRELTSGSKESCWIWFIFPHIKGLRQSVMTKRFSISSLVEAQAFIEHPILSARLIECTQLVLNIEDKNIMEILGTPDNVKFQASMTLFVCTRNRNPIFEQALSKYFHGQPHVPTLEILRKSDCSGLFHSKNALEGI